MKNHTKKVGLPPETLVYTGDRKSDAINITVIDYDAVHYNEKIGSELPKDIGKIPDGMVRWINVCGLHDVSVISAVCSAFFIHPLVQEDILNTSQRPKCDEYPDYIYINMHKFLKQETGFSVEQIGVITGRNFVLSFSETTSAFSGKIADRIKNKVGLLHQNGTDYLLHSLLDIIVDDYFIVLEDVSERIEELEDKLILHPEDDTLQQIRAIKKKVTTIHKTSWPLREMVHKLSRGESAFISKSAKIYFSDLYDHVIQIIDTTENLREVATSLLDIYLSNVNNKMNEIMKVLTIISTVFIPLSFITSFYGMNFKYMPELAYKYAYPVVIFIMIAITVFLFRYFKKKKWL